MTGLFLKSVFEPKRLSHWAGALTLIHLLVFGFMAFSGRFDQQLIIQDSGEYFKLASYPLSHGFYTLDGVIPSAKREPGYSGFIMAFMGAGLVKTHILTVANVWPILAAQILLYGSICGALAKRMSPFLGHGAAYISLLLMQLGQLCPYQYALGNECITLILLGLVLLEIPLRFTDSLRWPQVLRLSLWLGLLAITKSVNVFFVPVLALLLWFRLKVNGSKLIVLVLLALAPAVSWTARNQSVFGMPIMGSMDGVSSLYRGNILPYQQISSPEQPEMPEEAKQALSLCKNDGERYQWYKTASLEWLKSHPLQYLKQCVHRTAGMLIELYRSEQIPLWRYPLDLILGNDQLLLTLILFISLFSVWRLRCLWAEVSIVFFLFSIAMYSAVYGQERYLHPAFFLLAPIHGWCLATLLIKWVGKSQASTLKNH
jgi:hypothetical protein